MYVLHCYNNNNNNNNNNNTMAEKPFTRAWISLVEFNQQMNLLNNAKLKDYQSLTTVCLSFVSHFRD